MAEIVPEGTPGLQLESYDPKDRQNMTSSGEEFRYMWHSSTARNRHDA